MTSARPLQQETLVPALVLMALAVSMFTAVDTAAKWLTLSGLPLIQVVFARYVGGLITTLILFPPRHGLRALRSNTPWIQTARAGCLLGSTALNFLALRYLPINITTAILFATPILVTLLSVPILGERVGWRRVVAVCFGFLGVLVVTRPWGAAFHPAMIASMGAAFCASMFFVLTRMTARYDSVAVSQLWNNGLATLAVLPFGVAAWQAPENWLQILLLMLVGALAGVGHSFSTYAHGLTTASNLAPVFYLQLFTAGAAGVLVFEVWPTVHTLIGALMIIAAGAYIWRRERRLRART